MLAHVHIMKTAGQTVCGILRRSFGANHCELRGGEVARLQDIRFAKRFYPGLASIGGHSVRPYGELLDVPGIRFYTFLRDPIARCLSHYQFGRHKRHHELDFLPWLEGHQNYQTRFLSGTEDAAAAIEILDRRIGFVGLVEDFDYGLLLLEQWSGVTWNLAFRSRNIARNGQIKQQILNNSRLMDAAIEAHQADIAVYEYAREKIYPLMRSTYRPEAPRPANAPSKLPLIWPAAKRNLIYKPLSKVRDRGRAA